MRTAWHRSRNLARALVAATFVLAFRPPAGGLAQGSEQDTDAASDTATTADQPRRSRQRRRAADEVAASADAEAQGTATSATAATSAPAPGVEVIEERLVCKSEKLAGTKISRRTCGTPEQWAARTRRTSEAARDAVQEIRDRSAFPAPPEVPLAIP